ncbi:MAG: molecular chaperone DnaJ [Deltaproteobacteria bacterium]|nr:molecular chaperone DnaJ [Deltaproteobacteria bacterium]
MTPLDELYAVLGVAPGASASELKAAYRAVARKYHPDKNPGDSEAERVFKAAAEAYGVLSDEGERERFLKKKGRGAPDPTAKSAEDLFREVFGNRRPAGARKKRGEDLKLTLELTLEESFSGVERRLELPRTTRCARCVGTGAEPGSVPVLCSTCAGSGRVQAAEGFFTRTKPCVVCRGSGRLIPRPCSACKGEGSAETVERFVVSVPRGVTNGTRLKISGRGRNGEHGGASGDLFVIVAVKPHELFERVEDDVVIELPIRFDEATLGASVEVPTLEGAVSVTIPKGTTTGRMLRLRSLGFERDGVRGDQLVRVVVEVPNELSSEAADQLRAIGERLAPEGSRVFAFRERVRAATHKDHSM